MNKYEASEHRNSHEFLKAVREMAAQGYAIHSWQVNSVTGLIVVLYVLEDFPPR